MLFDTVHLHLVGTVALLSVEVDVPLHLGQALGVVFIGSHCLSLNLIIVLFLALEIFDNRGYAKSAAAAGTEEAVFSASSDKLFHREETNTGT